MKVKVLKPIKHNGKFRVSGEMELPEANAYQLIELGYAEEVKTKAVKNEET